MLLRGGAAADTLVGEEGFDTLIGLGGNDSLEGGQAFDLLTGGAGNDTLRVGTPVFEPDEFRDLIDTAPPVPQAAINTRNSAIVVDLLGPLETPLVARGNVAVGGAGNDLIIGSAYFDTLIGGGGADTIRGVSGQNFIFGGGGADVLNGGLTRDTLIGAAGDDVINGRNGSDLIAGGAGNDRINGGFNNDSITGGVGNDTILGGFNRDRILGQAGDDELFGGAGNDGLNGGDGNDIIDGGADRDTLLGEGGNDLLRGGRANDIIVGGAGADTLFGGEGRDTLRGDADGSGRGIDTFVLDGNPVTTIGFDLIVDFQRVETIQISRDAFNIRGRQDFEIVDTFSREVTIVRPGQETQQQPSARFFYERASGGIYRNLDGRLTGGGGEILVAQVNGFTNLENSNFQFID